MTGDDVIVGGPTARGLSAVEAARRLAADGPNVLPTARPPSALRRLGRQLTHRFAAMLWVASGLALVAGMPPLAVAIVVVVLLNGGFAFAQEYRADRAAARLRDLMPANVIVVRDGHRCTVPAADLVVGDLVALEPGDRVSADLRLVEAHGLRMDTSALTGESVPEERAVGQEAAAGTFVVVGAALGVVTATGADTRLGAIAHLTTTAQRPPSPLARRIDDIVRVVGLLAVGVGVGLAGLGMLLGASFSEAMLLGVGATVALVPEGLLPTVTLALARGARSMAGQQALVRRLDAVETLGATTVICTDKTGTLTANAMTVVRVWTPVGVTDLVGAGYGPVAQVLGDEAARAGAARLAAAAMGCVSGRVRPAIARSPAAGGREEGVGRTGQGGAGQDGAGQDGASGPTADRPGGAFGVDDLAGTRDDAAVRSTADRSGGAFGVDDLAGTRDDAAVRSTADRSGGAFGVDDLAGTRDDAGARRESALGGGGPDRRAASGHDAGAARAAEGATPEAGRAEAIDGAGFFEPVGDPMEAALHVLAIRLGVLAAPTAEEAAHPHSPPGRRFPFDPVRRRSSAVVAMPPLRPDLDPGELTDAASVAARVPVVLVVGAPDAVLPCCAPAAPSRGVPAESGRAAGPGPVGHDPAALRDPTGGGSAATQASAGPGSADAGDVVADPVGAAEAAVQEMADVGLRTLAVAWRPLDPGEAPTSWADAERDLTLLGVVGLEDPPRAGAHEAVAQAQRAGIRIVVVTGDHPRTAAAVAREVGLLPPREAGRDADSLVVVGADLPPDDTALGLLLDRDHVVVARVTPEDKLRIARALRGRGHVVAMTGDGVNDAPALREADIGVAMGRSGTDVAREAADLVLLDDHLQTVLAAVALGRATFANIRRFLAYHLTDNVAELTPFAAWALTGGSYPAVLAVLQVLLLDIGTDILPALALGAEPPSPRVMDGPARVGSLVDRHLLGRVLGVLGPVEALVEMTAATAVLLAGGWAWGVDPDPALLAAASGAAFATVVIGQMANAAACRSETRPVWRLPWRGAGANPLLIPALAVSLGVLAISLAVPPFARLLGQQAPGPLGWAVAVTAVPAVVAADSVVKWGVARRRARGHATR